MKTYNPQNDEELTVVFDHNKKLMSCEELFQRELDDGQKVIGFQKGNKYYVKGYLMKDYGWSKFYVCEINSKDGYGTIQNSGWNYYEDMSDWVKETE